MKKSEENFKIQIFGKEENVENFRLKLCQFDLENRQLQKEMTTYKKKYEE